ncbi:hypothetical protein [Micromonospora sp. CPCC 206061]|uniref:hypothetical protein n=1 Tax=Micromonospora sp. CPCC 206061 TaxID=3122410 RepID=UPI002FEEEDFA
MTAPAAPRRVHLIDGLVPSGGRVYAVCTCGARTTPRVSEDRALAALVEAHPLTEPKCALCGADHAGHDWLALRSRYVQVVADPATGDQFLACRGMPRSCQDGAAQRQLHLDRAAAEAFGLEPRPPAVRVVGGTAMDGNR